MSISAQTLMQAREALIASGHQKLVLMSQIKDQDRRIEELEAQLNDQRQVCNQLEQTLAETQNELQKTKNQLPDDATYNAFEALVQFLAAPAQTGGDRRAAA